MQRSRSKRLSVMSAMVLAPVVALAACGGSNGTTAQSPTATSAAPTSSAPVASDSPSAAVTDTDGATPAASDGASESAGAGTGGATSTAGAATKVGLVYDIGGKGDKSFNDQAFAGVSKAAAQLGVTYDERSPNSAGTDRADLMTQLAQKGDTPIIGVGFLFEDAIKKVAPKFPKIQFAIIDDVVALPNVTSLTFSAEQSSYLVGVVAALKSTTGTVGFIGGVQTPLLQVFEAGFTAGVKATKSSDKVLVKYLTQPPDFGGFAEPDKAQVAAKGDIDGGADVIYTAAGGSGAGTFTAVTAANAGGKKIFDIGVDSDQYLTASDADKKFILTSALKREDTAVFLFIQGLVSGKASGGTTENFDLKDDGVGYSTSGGLITDVMAQVEAAKAKIIAGTITVPTKPGS